MKKGKFLLPIIISLFLIQLISAASFSIGTMVNEFGGENLVLITIFFILLATINYALGKAIDNKPTVGVISTCFALLATYGMHKLDFDVEGMLLNIGVPESVMYYLFPMLLLISSLIIFWKLGLGVLFLLLGIFLLGMSAFTDFFYESTVTGVIGALLILFGAWLLKRKYFPGTSRGPKGPKPERTSSPPKPRIDILIKEAKAFRKWADKQPKPKMVRNWAYFIAHLKNRKYGSDEKDIMNKLNVTQQDIVKVVKKYIL
ncbi:hypothetical protein J4481_01845 [Candidatus Pacearchaeota archaeon]|nr:hypothetical protein [Candidatus Pacearchaeota archaeon]